MRDCGGLHLLGRRCNRLSAAVIVSSLTRIPPARRPIHLLWWVGIPCRRLLECPPAAVVACVIHDLFPSALRRPGHLSLLVQRKVTQREDAPLPRLPGLLPSRCACGLRGLSTVHPWPDARLAAFLAATLRAVPPATRRCRGSPKSDAPSRARRELEQARRIAVLLWEPTCGRPLPHGRPRVGSAAAQLRRATPGPTTSQDLQAGCRVEGTRGTLWRGGGPEGIARRGAHTMCVRLASGQGGSVVRPP